MSNQKVNSKVLIVSIHTITIKSLFISVHLENIEQDMFLDT
jgi:hypothetical protein